ncbi:hypothetical protein BCON_0136g00150 [Botryotinia convoluta]|uniref:Uncharacterized protein n=1 Tax=Botryotinia convoluta TaxID=54673 RepID=A0A4Z1I1W1_9HELO|nr:hypothetical protein BCON_0136g00150 [Botryotinia convoluta]
MVEAPAQDSRQKKRRRGYCGSEVNTSLSMLGSNSSQGPTAEENRLKSNAEPECFINQIVENITSEQNARAEDEDFFGNYCLDRHRVAIF